MSSELGVMIESGPLALPPSCIPSLGHAVLWKGQAGARVVGGAILTALLCSLYSMMSMSSAPRSLCTWPASPP